MKTNKFLLIVLSLFITSVVSAQVKKKVVKKTTTTAAAPKSVANQKNVQNTVVSNESAETKTVLSNSKDEDSNKAQLPSSKSTAQIEPQIDNPYRAALGVKFLWGISLTGKYFIKPHQALEAIIRYKGYQGIGNDLAFSAVYEYEKQIPGAEGFNWYAGAGAYFGHFSYKNSFSPDLYGIKASNTYYGLSVVVGLEYKIKQLPIAISADWMPSFDFKGSAFVAENGGIGVKYTF